jgi:hypothetical protein
MYNMLLLSQYKGVKEIVGQSSTFVPEDDFLATL